MEIASIRENSIRIARLSYDCFRMQMECHVEHAVRPVRTLVGPHRLLNGIRLFAFPLLETFRKTLKFRSWRLESSHLMDRNNPLEFSGEIFLSRRVPATTEARRVIN